MIVTYGPQEKRPQDPGAPSGAGGSVVSIGVFDGVHLGHQAILEGNLRLAHELGATPAVITFRRHPKRVLLGRAPRTLTSLEHRLELFRQAGVGRVLVLAFDEALRDLSPETFIERFALGQLDARAFVLGFDSKFGRDRRGTPELLRSLGHRVVVVDKVLVGDRAVSSTAIREAVELGDLASAERMLGRPVSVLGTVVQGEARGRTIGFPTANLNLHHELHPPAGVYAGRARVFRRERPADPSDSSAVWEPIGQVLELDAVANVGVRPTVAGPGAEPRLEVHLFDFPPGSGAAGSVPQAAKRAANGPANETEGAGGPDGGDLYGAHLEFQFVARLREEQRFASLEALREQIARDVARARELLAHEGAPRR